MLDIDNVFEVHVGFPRQETGALSFTNLDPEGSWKILYAMEVLSGLSPQSCLDSHDVPGTIGALATMRFKDLSGAQDKMNEVASRLGKRPDVRIELEQVLLTQDALGPNQNIRSLVSFKPRQDMFEHAQLIADTPTFESHYIISSDTHTVIEHELTSFTRIAREAGMALDQAARFSVGQSELSEQRIVLTTFFERYRQLGLAQEFGERLQGLICLMNSGLRLKVVAERILLCVQPT